MDNIYPVVIIAARYGGVYEGGRWLAFTCYDGQIPHAATGDDITCATWWSTSAEAKKVGRGDTPNEALMDLALRIQKDS